MSNKAPVNIFETLRGNESSDEELTVVKTKDPNQKRIRPKKNKEQPAPQPTTSNVVQPSEDVKESTKKEKFNKDQKPNRKVSEDPHPKDK